MFTELTRASVSVWQYSIHVCRNGQVRALTYGKIMSMNLNAIDFWID